MMLRCAMVSAALFLASARAVQPQPEGPGQGEGGGGGQAGGSFFDPPAAKGPATRPTLLTFDLTGKPARALQTQLDARLPLGTNAAMVWRDKPQPGEQANPSPSRTELELQFVPPPRPSDPKDAEKLPGLLVFISPSNAAMLPQQYMAELGTRRLAVVSPVDAGNEKWINWRLFAAVAAVKVAQEKMEFDPVRIYVSGMSGGGRMSHISAELCPDVFAGAMPICGTGHWRNVPSDKPNGVYGGLSPLAPRSFIDAAKGHPFVLVTGNRDFNCKETLLTETFMREEGFRAVSSMVCPDLGHQIPRANDFATALATLEEPAMKMAGELFQRGVEAEKRKRVGEALLLFRQAWSRDAVRAPQAEENYRRLKLIRDSELAAAEALAEPKRAAALRALGQRWDAKGTRR